MTQGCDCAASRHPAQNWFASLLSRLDVTPTGARQSRSRVSGISRLIASISRLMRFPGVTAIETEG